MSSFTVQETTFIRMLRCTNAAGKLRQVGEKVEVEAAEARLLCGMKKAEPLLAKAEDRLRSISGNIASALVKIDPRLEAKEPEVQRFVTEFVGDLYRSIGIKP